MTPSESLSLVEQLLFHQYGSLEAVTNFVRRLYEICEKMLPKKNTMYCCGAPNSGKSWFFEMVATYYLNIGHVKNFTKYTTFPLNDCVNRRILLWNEPSIAPSQYETVKMLAGGDPCAAAVKYEGDAKVLRTPLLITANHTIFSRLPAMLKVLHGGDPSKISRSYNSGGRSLVSKSPIGQRKYRGGFRLRL